MSEMENRRKERKEVGARRGGEQQTWMFSRYHSDVKEETSSSLCSFLPHVPPPSLPPSTSLSLGTEQLILYSPSKPSVNHRERAPCSRRSSYLPRQSRHLLFAHSADQEADIKRLLTPCCRCLNKHLSASERLSAATESGEVLGARGGTTAVRGGGSPKFNQIFTAAALLLS